MALTKVTKSGLTDDSVDASKIEDGTIVSDDIAPGTITNAKLTGSIANDKLANSSITINGTSVSLGGSVTTTHISWQSVITADGSTNTSAVSGYGYFIDTTSNEHTITLPASPSAGDYIAIKDYAETFGTNKLIVGRNGSNIQGIAQNSELTTNRASVLLVYVDSTKGWLYTEESNVGALTKGLYTEATGGTVTTDGDHKLHTFLTDGCFVVSQAGNSPVTPNGGPNVVDYLVIAGGGGGVGQYSGGGAGGFRMSIHTTPTTNPLNAATPNPARTISAQTYPITVGAGGAASPTPAASTPGSNSVFNTITSAGGGSASPKDGGSGSGASGEPPNPGTNPKGSGNTPPVSPPQGNPGGANSPSRRGGGGGGAGAAGGLGTGGAGSYVPTTFLGPTAPTRGEPGPNGRYFAGGGGGGTESTPGSPFAGGLGGGGNGGNQTPGTAGSTNMGAGGGSGSRGTGNSGSYYGAAGGSGIVIIRYKFQN